MFEADGDAFARGYIRSAPDAIVLADPETRAIVDANEAAEEFFGYDRDELRSLTIHDIHPADETERYERLFDDHLEHQPAVISRFGDGSPVYVVTADGDRVPVEINAWLTEIDGQPVLQGVFRDVSERLRRERELERQNQRLDEFASIVAHDLRNPLMVARGRAELLANETQSEHVEPILDALDRIESIVEDTLTLAREGDAVGERDWVDVAALSDDCWALVDPRGASLEVVDAFAVRADRDRLQHVLENLFRNAVEHGGPDVTVRVGVADETTMFVEDDGRGIPAEEREAVFEPGHSTTRDGTGFGLTIVKRLATAHGWEVTLTESDAGGARFEFGGVRIRA
ncbi:MAG: sensor histidine kinase [Halobacteriales archaeon]